MIALEVADLVVIASRTLQLDTDRVLELLDLTAAEHALAEARSGAGSEDPASQAAWLLLALVRQRPLRRGNQPVALAAMLQFLALNAWEVDLDPPEATRTVVAKLEAGTLDAGDVTDWLAPRLRLDDRAATCAKEAPMRRWLPLVSVKLRARPGGMFRRFTDRARRAVQLAQEEARLLNHNYVGTEHLLLGLLREEKGIAAQVLTDAVENRRQSVSGVSMDEEMSNLVRFQRAYQASSRAMSTMDEMLDVLINRTGRVGL